VEISMLLRPAVLIPVIVLTTAVAVARDDATPNASDAPIHIAAEPSSNAQRSACTPDVLHMCRQFIPDINEIVACLKMQRSNLSPACRAVFH
jgi:hypothetical protein